MMLGLKIVNFQRNSLLQVLKILYRDYAKKFGAVGKMAAGSGIQKKRLEVEIDAHKLVNYVCGLNYHKEGDDPQLKNDSDYPEWLWTLRTSRQAVSLEELDPDTWAYWNKLKHLDMARRRKFLKHALKS